MPRSPGPQPPAAQALEPEQLGKDQISDVVSQAYADLRRCYEDAGTVRPLRFSAAFQIGPDGSVSDVQVSGDAEPAIVECLAQTVGQWHFPHARTATPVRLPMAFGPIDSNRLSVTQINGVVLQGRQGIRRCYDSLLRGWTEPVRLDIELQIAPAGNPTSVRVTGSPPAMNDCVDKELRKWQFPGAAQATKIRVPIVLQPGG